MLSACPELLMMAATCMLLPLAVGGGAAAGTVGGGGGVTLSLFDNSAFHGSAASSATIPGLSFTREVKSGSSIELTGTLTLPPAAVFNFSCAFANTSYAFLWVDDHLVCQDSNVYKPPISRLDLPLGKLNKAALPVVLRAYVGPSAPAQLPRPGTVAYIGNYYDGDHGKAGARALRFGPQGYGFTPESCAAACPLYEYIALQDVGGRLSRKVCAPGPNTPGPNCTATSGYCSCDSELSKATGQGRVAAPANCLQPIQGCSWVNSVYKGLPAPAPAPLPPGAETRTVSVAVSWQQLSPPAVYGGAPGPAMSPLLPLDSRRLSEVAGGEAAAAVAPAAPSLSPTLAPVEVQRRAMQAGLASGWATWVFDDMIALAELPSGLTVR